MATGMLQGPVFEWPAQPETGYDTWAAMSGMQPGHPLVGGNAGRPGYEGGQRQVAIADPATNATLGAASGSPASAHFSEILNFKGNPIGWVLLFSIAYLALTHMHMRAGAGVRYR